MIVNDKNNTMDVEARDFKYVLATYVRLYKFQCKNAVPEKIIFPMFKSIPHPDIPGAIIPIEYVAEDSPQAIEIAEDGSNVAETTPEAEAVADLKEQEYDSMKEKIAKLEAELTVAANTTAEDLIQEEADQKLEIDTEPTSPTPEDLVRQEKESAIEEQPISPAKAAFAEQNKLTPVPESAPEKNNSAK